MIEYWSQPNQELFGVIAGAVGFLALAIWYFWFTLGAHKNKG